ncbi:MAG: coA-transferase family protein [Hydrocarboniphaga sp.]|uniref:CaiB/BaiF CoA transferase family protein n=1 Tax=Hydrocarboniphaga sp. TaxID=2033016 RepID=UPI00260F5D2D|nr:CoA transferase [Hydrocarboniphaga sp.]MDB5970058.1 coA-transferase family protein [Hydrocarboniphaga sp.]
MNGGDSRPEAPRRLRVVELGSWLAAPGAAALLADIGAEVIKIEPPSGDPGRRFIAAMGGAAETTPSFSLLNRGKKSVVLDLQQKRDHDLLSRLLFDADVFVTNLRAGSLARLDLEPDTVRARYPQLIFASISGLGLRGPERDLPVYDVGGFWARSGLMHQLVPSDGIPPSPTGGFGDLITSLSLYSGIVTALLERQRTGKGSLVETSLMQAGAFMVSGDLAVQASHGRVHGQSIRSESRTPLVNSYRSSDGRWFFLTCVEARRHLPKVCKAIGRTDLIKDPRFATAKSIRSHGRELVAILDEAFSQMTLAQWAQRFTEADVWWQAVATPEDVLKDPQVLANDMTRLVGDGTGIHPMVTSPFQLSRGQSAVARAPDLGEHTDEVLRELSQ